MTEREVAAIIREIGSYEDSKIKCGPFDSALTDGPGGYFVILKTDPPEEVYSATSWGGRWGVATFRPGRWCDYLQLGILPLIREQRRLAKLTDQAQTEQRDAPRFAEIDDSGLFN